jgi:hypothetical protein
MQVINEETIVLQGALQLDSIVSVEADVRKMRSQGIRMNALSELVVLVADGARHLLPLEAGPVLFGVWTWAHLDRAADIAPRGSS